jgi:hypothetical protein
MGYDALIRPLLPDISIEDWWRTSLMGLPKVQMSKSCYVNLHYLTSVEGEESSHFRRKKQMVG